MAQRRRVAQRLAGVGRLIAVMSGKGGVGKSYVTAHAARALARGGGLLVSVPPGVARFRGLGALLAAAPAGLTVTIPAAESGDGGRRALRAAVGRGARPLGMVENMVGGAFVGVAGETLARQFGTPL